LGGNKNCTVFCKIGCNRGFALMAATGLPTRETLRSLGELPLPFHRTGRRGSYYARDYFRVFVLFVVYVVKMSVEQISAASASLR